jgi:hypothetical protein
MISQFVLEIFAFGEVAPRRWVIEDAPSAEMAVAAYDDTCKQTETRVRLLCDGVVLRDSELD